MCPRAESNDFENCEAIGRLTRLNMCVPPHMRAPASFRRQKANRSPIHIILFRIVGMNRWALNFQLRNHLPKFHGTASTFSPIFFRKGLVSPFGGSPVNPPRNDGRWEMGCGAVSSSHGVGLHAMQVKPLSLWAFYACGLVSFWLNSLGYGGFVSCITAQPAWNLMMDGLFSISFATGVVRYVP